MSERCLEGVWKVSKTCLEGASKVSGRPRLDRFGQIWLWKVLDWVVSECCLDIMEDVWKEHLRCLESTC